MRMVGKAEFVAKWSQLRDRLVEHYSGAKAPSRQRRLFAPPLFCRSVELP